MWNSPSKSGTGAEKGSGAVPDEAVLGLQRGAWYMGHVARAGGANHAGFQNSSLY